VCPRVDSFITSRHGLKGSVVLDLLIGPGGQPIEITVARARDRQNSIGQPRTPLISGVLHRHYGNRDPSRCGAGSSCGRR
jgi:hypothetical protein